MSETIGALRHRLRLQRPLRSGDDIGGAAASWSDEGEVWAAAEAAGGDESADYDTRRSRVGFTFTINRRDDVRAGWRVLWGVRTLQILAVRDDGGARIVLISEEERL